MFPVWIWASVLPSMTSWTPAHTRNTSPHTHTHRHTYLCRHFPDVWIMAKQSEVSLRDWTSLRFGAGTARHYRWRWNYKHVHKVAWRQREHCFTISPTSQHLSVRKCASVQWTECVVVHNLNVMMIMDINLSSTTSQWSSVLAKNCCRSPGGRYLQLRFRWRVLIQGG